jgi:hypothetical protein
MCPLRFAVIFVAACLASLGLYLSLQDPKEEFDDDETVDGEGADVDGSDDGESSRFLAATVFVPAGAGEGG